MKRFFGTLALFFVMTGGNWMSLANERPRNPLLGKWEYVDCSIKNTSVTGTVEFLPDATFLFNGQIHEDYPTTPFQRKYRYQVSGHKLIVTNDYPAMEYPPISPFFFIESDSLYFSVRKMKSAEDDWTGSYRKANWNYRLVRAK